MTLGLMVTMDEPSDEQIVAALEASGFLFEHQCASALEAFGFHVETSWPFADPEQGKSRELDLRAIRSVHHDESTKIQVFVELLAECKDFEAPLVFLERPKNKREVESPKPNEYCFPKPHYRRQLTSNSYREVPGFEYFDLANKHYYYREKGKATQFAKVVRKGNKWTANHDGIHDAIVLPLAKVLDARRSQLPKHAPRAGEWCAIWLFFPMVLIRNRLLVHVPDSPSSLVERGRVTYVRGLESESLHGSYMIDFVKFAALQTYIQTEVLTFAAVVTELAATNAKAFRGE
jgi:hypothetical protein